LSEGILMPNLDQKAALDDEERNGFNARAQKKRAATK
jgi:hypothetical protein